WHANHFSIFKFGRNQHNIESIGSFTETFAGAGGASTFADGVDVGGEIPNPISRMANVETVESTFPIRYLFRRRRKDSGRPGKWRGGTGEEMAVVSHKAPDGGIHYVLAGKGSKFPMSEGLSGGFPGATNNYLRISDDIQNPLTNTPAVKSSNSKNVESIQWGVYPLMGDDELYVYRNGGGGYGDPLDREPELVARDFTEGLISKESASNIYGVMQGEDGEWNEAETNKLREEMRKERIGLNVKV